MSAVTVHVHAGFGDPVRLSGPAAMQLLAVRVDTTGELEDLPAAVVNELELQGLIEVCTARCCCWMTPLGERVLELLEAEVTVV